MDSYGTLNADKVEKIFLKSEGPSKVNHLPLESKNENNPIQAFFFERLSLNRQKHVICFHFRFQNICFTFW